jgi:hypothetical protein
MNKNTEIKNNLYILDKYINNNFKLIPFKVTKNNLGEVKYLPPVSKEWKNSVYLFNSNKLKNFPVYDLNINYIIKSYFNSYFHYKFIDNEYKPRRFRRISMNKIYVSKAEVKHTNSKALITIYSFNREKFSLIKKMMGFFKKFSYNQYLKLKRTRDLYEKFYLNEKFGARAHPSDQKSGRVAAEKNENVGANEVMLILSGGATTESLRPPSSTRFSERSPSKPDELAPTVKNFDKKKLKRKAGGSRILRIRSLANGVIPSKKRRWLEKFLLVLKDNSTKDNSTKGKKSTNIWRTDRPTDRFTTRHDTTPHHKDKNNKQDIYLKKLNYYRKRVERFENRMLWLKIFIREAIMFSKNEKSKFEKKIKFNDYNIREFIPAVLRFVTNMPFKKFNNTIRFKIIKYFLFKEFSIFRRFKLRLLLNKHKFEERLLYLLSSLISKYYNKKVEFNIVNMKSIHLNSDIFTNILTLKLKNKKANIIRMMNIILNRAVMPNVKNTFLEKCRPIKSVNFNLIENKYRNTNINFALKTQDQLSTSSKKNSLDIILNKLYENNFNLARRWNRRGETVHRRLLMAWNSSGAVLNKFYDKIYEIIFNSIKYKNTGGVRLEVSGRLTKRYRADRALYKVRLKGGLRNIDSSYKGLSSVTKRGYLEPNVEYSIFTSKRRVGSYDVKGWISGK